ncbi:hypothetical protein ACIRRA_39995 [Nocardia sp. NPDC101769]|uniref:hypothetical protein n=1 Tax=Nocardia sp. NPDC101769 TaxID=3364333 RepID=UPI0037FB343B
MTSTPAMIGKMLRIAADPRVALVANGALVQAAATVLVDRDGSVFAHELLAQEARLSWFSGPQAWIALAIVTRKA